MAETTLLRAAGEGRPAWPDAVPLLLFAVLGVLTTVLLTVLQERTDVLKLKEEQLSDFVESAPVGLHWLAEDGSLLWVNGAMHELLGAPREDIAGRRLAEFFENPAEAEALLARLRGGQPVKDFEARLRSAGGPVRTVLLDANVLWQDGRFVHARCFTRDISARKAAETAWQRVNERLEDCVRERTRELEEANRELEAFACTVSHVLRAPARAIHGFARVIEEDHGACLEREGRRLLGNITRHATRMRELIDDLLSFSRLGRQALHPITVDMTALVHSVIEDVCGERPRGRASFRVQRLPAATGDASLLRQVWTNLLANAVKFTRPGVDPVVDVGALPEAEGTTYFVRDNGAGFDMKHAEKLFGMFTRLHGAEDHEGTGVGLAIVQRVVQRHGGSIRAEAAPGGGATFYFTLPHVATVTLPAAEVCPAMPERFQIEGLERAPEAALAPG
jgi:PAS domain S-box-containing protein